MKATIWHNPKCGTSRKTLAILENLSRVEVEVIEYLKDPPSAEKLAQLYKDAGTTPNAGLRLRGTDAAERGLPEASAEDVLAAMAADPIPDRASAGRNRQGRPSVPAAGHRARNSLAAVLRQRSVGLQRARAIDEHDRA